MEYEKLLEEADKNGIYVIERANFKSSSEGLINGDVIGINKNIYANAKRTCVLAEELGHYHTTVGDILDQTSINNQKQELLARLWAYNRLIGLYGIVACYKKGCQSLSEMAEYLGVTEDFLSEAIACYRQKYGIYERVDNYIVYFEPNLHVFEVI